MSWLVQMPMECNITWASERRPQPRNLAKEKEWQIWKTRNTLDFKDKNDKNTKDNKYTFEM